MSLFPQMHRPYVITAPAYTEKSAGVKVLHMLCHALNAKGYKAYISPMSQTDGFTVSPILRTPMWDKSARDGHLALGLEAIAVYPDIVIGNPLMAKHVVRWMLFYPGLYGGAIEYGAADKLWAFSLAISQQMGIGDQKVLYCPPADMQVFHPLLTDRVRYGRYFYAHKHRSRYHGKMQDITEGAREITTQWPESQYELAELLRGAEVLYVYEDTTLALAATLCGCPVVMLPSEHFTSNIIHDETGGFGMAWGVEHVLQARETVGKIWKNYPSIVNKFWMQLDKFVADTQKD